MIAVAMRRLALACTLLAAATTTSAALPLNNVPILVGKPQVLIAAGTAYQFKPFFADLDHDPLAFSIANKPAWATFNIATGELSGTPANRQAGNYPGIVISASDGKATVALPPFFVVVMPGGTATVSWSPPVAYTNGSPLSDLAGYRIYYQRYGSVAPLSVTIPSPTRTSFEIGGLASGLYLFRVTAYNSRDVESAPTPDRFKLVP